MSQPTLSDVIPKLYDTLITAQAAQGVLTEDDVKAKLASDRDAATAFLALANAALGTRTAERDAANAALAQRTAERDALQAKIDKVKADVA